MKIKKYRNYSFELKKKAVELYFEGHRAQDIAEQLDLSGRRIVTEWVKLVREANTFDALRPNQGLPRKNSVKKETLQEENERLKLENLYLKKLLDLRKG